MKTRLIALTLIITALTLSGCSKDDEPESGSDILISASAYIGDDKAVADIGFYPYNNPQTGLENIRNFDDPSWVRSLFDEKILPAMETNTSQYSANLNKGRYFIVIRIASDPIGDLDGVYTYKLVDISKGSSTGNVMEFNRGYEGLYQEWKDKN